MSIVVTIHFTLGWLLRTRTFLSFLLNVRGHAFYRVVSGYSSPRCFYHISAVYYSSFLVQFLFACIPPDEKVVKVLHVVERFLNHVSCEEPDNCSFLEFEKCNVEALSSFIVQYSCYVLCALTEVQGGHVEAGRTGSTSQTEGRTGAPTQELFSGRGT